MIQFHKIRRDSWRCTTAVKRLRISLSWLYPEQSYIVQEQAYGVQNGNDGGAIHLITCQCNDKMILNLLFFL